VSRLADVQRLYGILYGLRERLGEHRLKDCHGRTSWPQRGVYFFFEEGELRRTSSLGPRVVRVGTHAITAKSTTTLWNRLSQHRGVARTGAGNHRGSIFRLLVGEALVKRDKLDAATWGLGSSRGEAVARSGLSREAVQEREQPVEVAVSRIIGAMPFVWVEVDDAPSPTSLRVFIERNAIALLSNFGKETIDPASGSWLGLYSGRDRVRASGLWNNNHVDEQYDPGVLDVLVRAATATRE
jgi:hypothetical protein